MKFAEINYESWRQYKEEKRGGGGRGEAATAMAARRVCAWL